MLESRLNAFEYRLTAFVWAHLNAFGVFLFPFSSGRSHIFVTLMKRGIGKNANAFERLANTFKRFTNAFERVLVFFSYSPFHQEGHIWSVSSAK